MNATRRPRTSPNAPIRQEQVNESRTRGRRFKGGQALDKFAIPMESIPPGTSYEWKRHTTLNAPDPSYDVFLRAQGWVPVPVERHPDWMPPGAKGAILRDGLILMERPVEYTLEAQMEDQMNARNQVRAKEAEMYGTPTGGFDRVDANGNPLVNIRKTI